MPTLQTNARRLAKLLELQQLRVVFAESCTGGLVAATLATVPGISDHLCGSAVTYRNDTKHQWLDVSSDKLKRPGAVSSIAAKQMACGVIGITPEADWAASVTGHLGPGAPARHDGVVYIGIASKDPNGDVSVRATKHQLESAARTQRQKEAASLVMIQLTAAIDSTLRRP